MGLAGGQAGVPGHRHVRGRDLVAVAAGHPAQGQQPGLQRERRLLAGEVPRRPGQGAWVGWAATGQLQGDVQQPGTLGGGEPFALAARMGLHQVGEDAGLVPFGVPGGQGLEGAQVGVGLVGFKRVLAVGELALAHVEQDGLAGAGHLAGVATLSMAALGHGQRFVAMPVVEQGLHAPAVAVPPVMGLGRFEQHQQLGVAAGRVQAGQAGHGAGIPAMALRARCPGAAQAGEELVGPGRGGHGAAAQGAPVVAEPLDPGHLVIGHGLPEPVQPGLPGLGRHLDAANQGHELLDDIPDHRLQAAGRVVDVLESRGQLLEQAHGPVGGQGRILAGHGPDLGRGLVQPLDGQVGLPAEGAAAEAGGEGPGGGGPRGPGRSHVAPLLNRTKAAKQE